MKNEYGGNTMKDVNLFGSWLTVNRSCNFRCLWCYAKGTEYREEDDMSWDLAQKLIDLEAEIGIKNIIFIGGEPTLWKDLYKANDYVKMKGMTSCLVTNGFLFSHDEFIKKLNDSPFDNITVSLKAGNEEQSRELTKTNSFPGVLAGIQNLAKNKHIFDVSITLNALISNNLSELVKVAMDNGSKGVKIEFCATVFEGNKPNRGYMMHQKEVVKCILSHYDKMDYYAKGNLMIEMSIPFCLWPNDFINSLKKKGAIISGCHVVRREGLIFDPKGKLIPCNDLYDYPLGQYGVDFFDVKSFLSFWKRPDLVKFYDRLIAYPVERCISCDSFKDCCGGCPLQWITFDPKEVIPVS